MAAHRGGDVENTDDGRPLRPPVVALTAEDVVCCNPALAVRRAGQGNLHGFAGHVALDLDDVTDGVDVRVAGPHVFVDAYSTPRPEKEARGACQMAFRSHSNAQ